MTRRINRRQFLELSTSAAVVATVGSTAAFTQVTPSTALAATTGLVASFNYRFTPYSITVLASTVS